MSKLEESKQEDEIEEQDDKKREGRGEKGAKPLLNKS